nr:hypothetical protein [Saccharopolyspora pogona]
MLVAAAPDVPAALVEQLRPGGRLVHPSVWAAMSRWCCSNGGNRDCGAWMCLRWPDSCSCGPTTEHHIFVTVT